MLWFTDVDTTISILRKKLVKSEKYVKSVDNVKPQWYYLIAVAGTKQV